MSIAGKVLCGHELPAVSGELHLLRVDESHHSKLDAQELEALPSDFCRDAYRQVMRMNGGPLVWSWLKPVLNGKVLYAPRSPAVERIVRTMNSTFTSGGWLRNSLQAWAQTAASLKEFYRLQNIEQRLRQTQPFIPLVLGGDFEQLFHDEETSQLISRLANTGGVLGLIQLFGNVAQCFDMNRFENHENELELEEAAKRLTRSHQLIAGIVFLNLDDQLTDALPAEIQYKIRADVDFVPGTKLIKERIWEPGPKDHFTKDLGYFKGFIQLQEMIDTAITRLQMDQLANFSGQPLVDLNDFSDLTLNRAESIEDLPTAAVTALLPNQEPIFSPEVLLQQMPYACYKEDKFGFYILALSPVISTVAWIFLIAFMIREFVLERELHLEEILMVTGLRSSVRWWVWFLIGFFVMAFGCACGLGIFKLAFLMPNSNFAIAYMYFLTFCFSIIMYWYASDGLCFYSFLFTTFIFPLFLPSISQLHGVVFLQNGHHCLSFRNHWLPGVLSSLHGGHHP